ncbi:MAG TPA: hypothetical protein VI233_14600 [Puia sp.]
MTSQSPTEQSQSLEALQDIKRMMERSSRFISLSGLSGVSAGICALIGAFIAHTWIIDYYKDYDRSGYSREEAIFLEWRLLGLGVAVLLAALATSSWFTWRKARKNQLPMWDHASKKLAINMAIPLGAGGLFVLGLINHADWVDVTPTCLVFYGLALVNSSKYTLTDIRYLGILEIILGIISMYYPHLGLYFWGFGFGVLHIIYGLIMWWKYERS